MWLCIFLQCILTIYTLPMYIPTVNTVYIQYLAYVYIRTNHAAGNIYRLQLDRKRSHAYTHVYIYRKT